jgi:uncharacterized Fe-S cluster-containing MiaB family protein
MLRTIEWLHNLWPLEWYSTPQNWLVLSVLKRTKPASPDFVLVLKQDYMHIKASRHISCVWGSESP